MILCCGEALIDMIPAPVASGQIGFVPHSGGAVFNTAIALGRLGSPAGMLTALSRDMFGAQLLADLTAAGVETSHIVRSDAPSTLAFVQVKDGQARYAFFDENSAERMLRPDDIPGISGAVKALFFGGISLAREPGGAAYAALANRVAGDHVVMLDPNIRPAFVADEATYRARLAAMMACADIVKLSDEDLDWVSRGEGAMPDQVARLRGDGPGLVIVTGGLAGATAYLASGAEVHVPSVPTDVVDTVGAGDTFNAGVLAALSDAQLLTKPALRSLTPEHIRPVLEFGARVAAVTVSRAGANPPWRHEVQASG